MKKFLEAIKDSDKTYVGAIAVAVISLIVYLTSVDPTVKETFALPLAGSFLMMLFKIYQQNRAQDFELAAASHMADQVFDKHAKFCETYLKKLLESIKNYFPTTFFGEGLIKTADELGGIRMDYMPWLPKEMDMQLVEMEVFLRSIGVDQARQDFLTGQERKKLSEEIFRRYFVLMGTQNSDNNPTLAAQKEFALADILDYFRGILGIRQLTSLRETVLKNAFSRIGQH